MTAKRIAWLTALVLLLTVGTVIWFHPPRVDPWHFPLDSVGVAVDRAVGATEAELCDAYGPPEDEFPGYTRFGLDSPLGAEFDADGKLILPDPDRPIQLAGGQFPASKIRSLKFRGNRAVIMTWMVRRGEEWVCVGSLWIRDPRAETPLPRLRLDRPLKLTL